MAIGLTLIATAVVAVISGLTGTFPIGVQTVIGEDGEELRLIAINPSEPVEHLCSCEAGGLKILVPPFELIKSEPSFTSQTLGTIERGEIVCVLDQNDELWWEVSVPRTCEGTGWFAEGAFPTVLLALVPEPTGDGENNGSDSSSGDGSGDDSIGGGFNGGVGGTAGITVSQALRLSSVTVAGVHGLGIVNDEGTRFTVAIETTVGSVFEVRLALRNESDSDLIGELRLDPRLVVSVSGDDGINGIGRLAVDGWKFSMAGDHDNAVPDVIIRVRVPSDVGPGFDGFDGSLSQVAF